MEKIYIILIIVFQGNLKISIVEKACFLNSERQFWAIASIELYLMPGINTGQLH